MRQLLLLVLFLSAALAGSALTNDDFTYFIMGGEPQLSAPNKTITLQVNLAAKTGLSAFDLVVRPSNLPQGVKVFPASSVIDFLKSGGRAEIKWQANAVVDGTYDLSNAFEVVGWDDSVKLELDAVPETVSEPTLMLRGWTDPAMLCEKHNYTGFWAEQANCQVKLTVAGEDHWAERSGAFMIDVDMPLKDGENRIDITAVDPGGNTAEKTVLVTYVPSIGTLVERNIILVVVALVLLVAGIVGLVVYYRGRQASKTDIRAESLESLREKQAKLFMEYARRCGVKGGFDEEMAKQLLDVFAGIVKRDDYYAQRFEDAKRAVSDREPIFRDDRVSIAIRGLLLERYAKLLQG